MLITKKFVVLFIILLVVSPLLAQTIKVKKESASVKSEKMEGYQLELDGSAIDVNTALVKFVKPIGKIKQSNDVITINELTVNGATYSKPVFALTKVNGPKASVWMGIKATDWVAENSEKVNKELEKLLYDFGVKFYWDKIQVQVDETLRASQAVEKQKQRYTNEAKNLNLKVENNKREKIQLEKSLVNNKLENETLLKKISKNKHNQDSVAIAGEQIKKITEIHKAKQLKIK